MTLSPVSQTGFKTSRSTLLELAVNRSSAAAAI